jgi:hypothetical protein
MAARKSFALRMSPELYEELRKWAAAEFRSVNGQIEFLLRQAVQERWRPSGGAGDDSVNDSVNHPDSDRTP